MDEQTKKIALRMISYGLYVIGVKGDSSVHAFTATWLSQASFKPPLVMLGVLRDGHSAKMIRESGLFSVNLLGKGQEAVAKTFFRCPAPKEGKFGEIAFELGKSGCPILEDVPAFLECRVVEIVEKGDHWVVVGEVIEAGVRKESLPLLLSQTAWTYGG